MKRYINGYNDDFYVFKVTHTTEEHINLMKVGLNHLYNDDGTIKLYTYEGYVVLPESAKELIENYGFNDVLSIDANGIVYEKYNSNSDDNTLVLTLQCNSNCIMCPCSEDSRKHSQKCSFEELYELLRYIPQSTKYLTVTGGEPTLLNEDFFKLMSTLQQSFDETFILLLTNGRAFGDYKFTQKFMKYIPDKTRLGIPIYGYNEETHDRITQTPGSFKQTVIGIHNLLHYNVDIELRIVLTKQNIYYIEKVARYITKYFSGVNCVNFMGLEMMGNAAKNKDIVWLSYDEMFEKAENAIKILISNGIDVQLYNFPLCAVHPAYWDICKKSISDYKIEFSTECKNCAVKTICGGIFDSTKRVTNFIGKPITR